MNLHLTPAEWAPIEAAGSGVLFREGEPVSWADENGRTGRPPAEFVEAAAACETCWATGDENYHPDLACADCHDGKRRVAVVVPCNCSCHVGIMALTSAAQDCPCWVRMEARSGYELPGENPDTTAWVKRCGFVTVGHVVVTWGPLVIGAFPMLVGEQVIRSGDELWYWPSTAERRLVVDTPGGLQFTEPDVYPLPPDVDPQSLVGQYAIGVEVVP